MGFSGGDGSSSITSSTDVALSNPVNGQVLTYNSAAAKWVNLAVPAAVPATTTTQGTIQLAGDLAGTASSPTVAKINGIILPSSTPAAGNVLTASSATATIWSTPAGGVTLDATATDIVADTTTGTAVAGSTGKAADAGHQHPLVAHDHSSTNKGGAIPESSITNLTTDLAAKAPLASPTFTGTVTVPTPVNTTDASTKAYVDSVSGVYASDPGTVNLDSFAGSSDDASLPPPLRTFKTRRTCRRCNYRLET